MTHILAADTPADMHDMTSGNPHYLTATLEDLALTPGAGRNIVEHYWATTPTGLLFLRRFVGIVPQCSPYEDVVRETYPDLTITLIRNVFVPDFYERVLFTPWHMDRA